MPSKSQGETQFVVFLVWQAIHQDQFRGDGQEESLYKLNYLLRTEWYGDIVLVRPSTNRKRGLLVDRGGAVCAKKIKVLK